MPQTLRSLSETILDIDLDYLVEPLTPTHSVVDVIKEYFPEELYSYSTNTNLYRLLTALIGDSGTRRLKKQILYDRLATSIHGVNFSDIDSFYNSVFDFKRSYEEVYDINPFSELVDINDWADIRRKDSWYRMRALTFIRGLQKGNTKKGLELIAEAACGVPCTVVEQWRYYDDIISDDPIGVENLGKTLSRNELVIVPDTDKLNLWDERRLSNILHRIKPSEAHITINPKKSEFINVPIRSISTSSNYFQSERYVTGSKVDGYPQKNKKYGLWIEPDKENLRPALSFGESQEFTTWLTIDYTRASSTHVGTFNRDQRYFFPHLASTEMTSVEFSPEKAVVEDPVVLEVTSPWVSRDEERYTTISNSLNLGYFADAIPEISTGDLFWASEEKPALEEDFLEFDLSEERSLNYLEFSVSTKPISFSVEVLNQSSGTWEEVDYVGGGDLNSGRTIIFTLNSNQWHLAQILFERVKTSKVRVRFIRNDDHFPYPNTPPFDWSIEVKGVKAGDIVSDINDLLTYDMVDNVFNIQDGTDVLKNNYRTIVDPYRFTAGRMLDGEANSYWQSQMNPSKFAVESIYLDIRSPDGGPSTVDSIYIDPITSGCLMHVYWTNEDVGQSTPPILQTAEDWRLWTPDPSHYILSRGEHKLRRPISAKYIKLEFTQLLGTPYNVPEVQPKPVRYRVHPSWVTDDLDDIYGAVTETSALEVDDNDFVAYDYINLGIVDPDRTKFDLFGPGSLEFFDRTVIPDIESTLYDYTSVWSDLDGDDTTQDSDVMLSINPFMENLIGVLNPFLFSTRAFIDATGLDSTFFKIEIPLSPILFIDSGTVTDKTEIVKEVTTKELGFFLRSRHGYKIVESPREMSVGYSVAIREISLRRNMYSGPSRDYEYYIDNLVDDVETTSRFLKRNEEGWGYRIDDTFTGTTDQELGLFDFDYVASP